VTRARTIESVSMRELLVRLGAIDDDRVEEFYPRTRDRADVRVLRDPESGVIFLDEPPATDYETVPLRERVDSPVGTATVQTRADSLRRMDQWHDLLTRKRVVDFGTGDGSFLDLASGVATVTGVELNARHQRAIRARGLDCASSLEELPDSSADVITMFHVLEHLNDPLAILTQCARVLTPDGRIVVEVPHARDFLITTLGSENFKAFTFWSQHLVLHTRDSLARLLAEAGFTNVVVDGYQRYGLGNHLYWLVEGQPGGHERWAWLSSPALGEAYAAQLQAIDQTDTLIAVAGR
jgi:2-polyprenyl-3-methyl-5-hydroxy-6-metoxy-1,4-benzoquinol methylase